LRLSLGILAVAFVLISMITHVYGSPSYGATVQSPTPTPASLVYLPFTGREATFSTEPTPATAPTPTQTVTPTATNTATPTNSPTPTPTTVTATPTGGHWTGNTGSGVSFDVSADGTTWSNFRLYVSGFPSCPFDSEKTTLVPGPGPISTNSTFSYGTVSFGMPGIAFSGTFNSATLASGSVYFGTSASSCGFTYVSRNWTARSP